MTTLEQAENALSVAAVTLAVLAGPDYVTPSIGRSIRRDVRRCERAIKRINEVGEDGQ